MPLPPESIIRARLAKAQQKTPLAKASEAVDDSKQSLLDPDKVLLGLDAVASVGDAETGPKVDSIADR